MPISAVDTIPLAFQHMRRQLLQPFRLGQWTRLAFVGLLAGEIGSSGGLNVPNFNGGGSTSGSSRHFLAQDWPKIDPAILGGLVATIVVTAFIALIVFLYISSVMRFILFDSVLTRECHIREGWRRRQSEGWKYFLWQLALTAIALVGLTILIGIPLGIAFLVGWLKEPRQHVAPLVLGGIFLFLLVMIFALAMALVGVLSKDFVVPLMAMENIGALEAWSRLWLMMKTEKGSYAGYIGMKILLAIGAGIIVGIATLILALVVAIPAVALGVLVAITGKSAGLTWDVYTITLAVVVGCILFAGFMYVLALISVPLIVFFPAYSIYFLAARYQALSAALYGAPPEPPPPLMPAVAPVV